MVVSTASKSTDAKQTETALALCFGDDRRVLSEWRPRPLAAALGQGAGSQWGQRSDHRVSEDQGEERRRSDAPY